MRLRGLAIVISTFVVAATSGCNTPTGSSDLELTVTAQVVAIQQTQTAQFSSPPSNQNQTTPIVIVVTATQAAPLLTNTAEPARTPQKPQIVNSTLCWLGPGPKYEVSSSLSKGQFVDLLGRGEGVGWLVIRNPTYNDPCWVQATDIKLDPSIDVNSLQVIYPPVFPTKTPKPIPTSTP